VNWKDVYKHQKLIGVDEAASKIKSHDRVVYSPGSSAPVDVINAIARRYRELEDVTMFTYLVLYPFEYLKQEYIGHIKHHTLFMGPFERKLASQGNVEATSYQFSQTDWIVKNRIKPNVFIAEVSEPDEDGNMSFGPMGTPYGHVVAQMADTIIVQVNREVPYVHGPHTAFINVRDVTWICEANHKIAELPPSPISDIDRQIACHIIEHIEDGSTIQLGIGSLANAVGGFLEHHKDLGVHTEMLTDSMATLVEKGAVTCAKKKFHPGELSVSFGLGSEKLYRFMDRNPMVRSYPICYICDPMNIAANPKFISINNTLMCDLTGQACSESLGFNQFSATGGQLNFVRGAAHSEGGKSFLAFPSTATLPDGTVTSRISAVLPPGMVVTTPRTDAQYFVTEYGVADVRNKSIAERVQEMVKIAHPDFREQLLRDAHQHCLPKSKAQVAVGAGAFAGACS
jgi:4-hydroxybutyrate CoA-transferase